MNPNTRCTLALFTCGLILSASLPARAQYRIVHSGRVGGGEIAIYEIAVADGQESIRFYPNHPLSPAWARRTLLTRR